MTGTETTRALLTDLRGVAASGTHARRTGHKPTYAQYEGFRPARREHAPDAAPSPTQIRQKGRTADSAGTAPASTTNEVRTTKTMSVPLRFRLNHEDVEIHVQDPVATLLDVLRGDLGMTGTKSGCEIGYCGACTVIVDGAAVPSCLQMVGLLEGRDVRTVEDLSGPDGLDPVQQAFVKCSGFQCGFCTPGHVMALRALLDQEPAPGEERIKETVDGNYCRCTGYAKILDSAREAVVLEQAHATSGEAR